MSVHAVDAPCDNVREGDTVLTDPEEGGDITCEACRNHGDVHTRPVYLKATVCSTDPMNWPNPADVANGIGDNLSKEWFDAQDGDDFWLVEPALVPVKVVESSVLQQILASVDEGLEHFYDDDGEVDESDLRDYDEARFTAALAALGEIAALTNSHEAEAS